MLELKKESTEMAKDMIHYFSIYTNSLYETKELIIDICDLLEKQSKNYNGNYKYWIGVKENALKQTQNK
jgi:hypothetical protein